VVGEHDRDAGASGPQGLEGRQGVLAGVPADDPVIGAEAAAQLVLDPGERLRLVVDGEDDRARRGAVARWVHVCVHGTRRR
jgi:hypothetical protein